MYRSFSLIETLTTLVVLTIAVYFISPIYFPLQGNNYIQHEINAFRNFLYQIQSQSRFYKQNYIVKIYQQENKWCAISFAKKLEKSTACDCFNVDRCRNLTEIFRYMPISHNITVHSKKIYPNTFLNIDGVSGRFNEGCLLFKQGENYEILQINDNGVADVIQKGKRSQCKSYI